MTKLRERMLQDMQLRRLSERTQECYVRSVRQLVEHFNNKPPGRITEEELRNYFLHITNVKKWKRATVTIALCGIKFFYTQTLARDWTLLGLVRPKPERRLPVILTRDEIGRKRWLPAQRDYLMPNKAVANMLRGKFRDALKKTAHHEGHHQQFFNLYQSAKKALFAQGILCENRFRAVFSTVNHKTRKLQKQKSVSMENARLKIQACPAE